MVSADETGRPAVTVAVRIDGRPVGELAVDETALADASADATLSVDVSVGSALVEGAIDRYEARLSADPGAAVRLEDYLWEDVAVRLTPGWTPEAMAGGRTND